MRSILYNQYHLMTKVSGCMTPEVPAHEALKAMGMGGNHRGRQAIIAETRKTKKS